MKMGDALEASMNDDFALELDPVVAEVVLLHAELDFGLTMADEALINLKVGSWPEYERLKAHARDALVGVMATMQRLDVSDDVATAQQARLAALVAAF
jgi:hypothetical protein